MIENRPRSRYVAAAVLILLVVAPTLFSAATPAAVLAEGFGW